MTGVLVPPLKNIDKIKIEAVPPFSSVWAPLNVSYFLVL